MVKYYNHAAAEYLCNVDEFISTGECRKLTRLQNLKIRTQYPEVEQWYIYELKYRNSLKLRFCLNG
jgi:hypothetical protein